MRGSADVAACASGIGGAIRLHVPLAPPGIARGEVRRQESGARSQNGEHVFSAFCFLSCTLCSPAGSSCSIKRRSVSGGTGSTLVSTHSPLVSGQQCKPWARPTETARKERRAPGAERFHPFRSGNLQGTPSVGGGHKPRALARRLTDYPPLTLSGFIGCEGRLRYGALGKNTKKFETTLPASTSAIPRWIEAKDSS